MTSKKYKVKMSVDGFERTVKVVANDVEHAKDRSIHGLENKDIKILDVIEI